MYQLSPTLYFVFVVKRKLSYTNCTNSAFAVDYVGQLPVLVYFESSHDQLCPILFKFEFTSFKSSFNSFFIFNFNYRYCSGDFLEAFRQEYKRSVTHWKSTKCKDYFVNSDCEEHLEIWSMAVMVMLCLISSMACITLVILYTKK